MLKDFKGSKDEDSSALKAEIRALRERLLAQQQLVRDQKLPVIVLVEGWAAAGKGSLINELISEIDPRFYNVTSPVIVPETEERYPFLYPFAKAIPENGKIMFMDSGWMESAVRKFLRREITKDEYKTRIRHVNEFERQLRDGGYVVLKIFLHIDEDEQLARLTALKESAETEWRVTNEDLWQHKEYAEFFRTYDDFMKKTDDIIPWHVVDGSRRNMAVRDALKLLVKLIDKALEKGKAQGCGSVSHHRGCRVQEGTETAAETHGGTAQHHLPQEDPCDPVLRRLGRCRQGRQHPPRGLSAGSQRLRRDAHRLAGTP